MVALPSRANKVGLPQLCCRNIGKSAGKLIFFIKLKPSETRRDHLI